MEPDNYWGFEALHNFEKEGLTKYLRIHKNYSGKVLTELFHENYRKQYA